ncbi:MAG: hypothetical protein M3Y09_08835 [Actinomycetota bacterium]|nr:hypothetical protein [Actinomycetota bacterium]
MATTVPVEIDSELLALLRERHPGKSDRELIEQLAIVDLGRALFDDNRRMDADPEEVVLAEAVRAVDEVRAEME